MHWYDDIFDRTVFAEEDSCNYTLLSQKRFQNVIYDDVFLEVDARTIYEGLRKELRLVSFSDYLKRYLYIKAGFQIPFPDVRPETYRDLIVRSFKTTWTPPAFVPSSAKLTNLAKGWLQQESVSRETVFLLGFGLEMTPGDVSVFLTKALREQDINFRDPFEMICWYCLQKKYRAAAAIDFMNKYEYLTPVHQEQRIGDSFTVSMRDLALSIRSDEDLLHSLQILKGQQSRYPYSSTAFQQFLKLYGEARTGLFHELAEYTNRNLSSPEDVTPADIENSLYSGIPRTRGNLKKASASSLARNFSEKRLSRQRITNILAGKTSVCRYDLITLSFYSLTCFNDFIEQEDPVVRCRQFAAAMNQCLSGCFMGELNLSNPYESFILMCLLTENPFDAFEEVWSYSYEKAPE